MPRIEIRFTFKGKPAGGGVFNLPKTIRKNDEVVLDLDITEVTQSEFSIRLEQR